MNTASQPAPPLNRRQFLKTTGNAATMLAAGSTVAPSLLTAASPSNTIGVGCIGIENPQALIGDLVTDFIRNLQEAKVFSDQSWEFLLEFILAIRFGWLAEWLRQSDKEMIDLEVVYLNLIVDNAAVLKKTWNI